MLVKCALNSKLITESVTSKAPPHHYTSSSMLHSGKTQRLEPKISDLDSSDQSTDFHRSNVRCSCFLAQASLFLLLVSFNSGFFAAIQKWRPDSCNLLWTVDVDMCLLLELCEAFFWAANSEAGNSNELCSKGNFVSSYPAGVLMRGSFIIVLDGFYDWLTLLS